MKLLLPLIKLFNIVAKYKYLMIAALGISHIDETYQVADPQITSYCFAVP